jgi:hypothetical protein
MNEKTVIVVSGLPRSGTSLVMNMLSKGGIELVTDKVRKADIDNPYGYFEFQRVKKIKSDFLWLDQCGNKAVKIVSPLLYNIPTDGKYKVIFVRRNLKEVMISQLKMVQRISPAKNTNDSPGELELENIYKKHLKKIETWLIANKIDTLFLTYSDIIKISIENAEKIGCFLEKKLNHEKMAEVVDTKLYRSRF